MWAIDIAGADGNNFREVYRGESPRKEIDGLKPLTDYRVRARACFGQQWGPYSRVDACRTTQLMPISNSSTICRELHNQSAEQKLVGWISECFGKPLKELKLLYRHSDEALPYAPVYGKSPTLTIVMSDKGYVCGAFTPIPIVNDQHHCQAGQPNKSFLFSISPKGGCTQHMLLPDHAHEALRSYDCSGGGSSKYHYLYFGHGDLKIVLPFERSDTTLKYSSQLGRSYSANGLTSLVGNETRFRVRDAEVFEVIFS